MEYIQSLEKRAIISAQAYLNQFQNGTKMSADFSFQRVYLVFSEQYNFLKTLTAQKKGLLKIR